MKSEDFKQWLLERYPDTNNTVDNRLSNCRKVEQCYDDLDIHYNKDKCNEILSDLKYSREDERENRKPLHNIPIDGVIRTGSATLKHAVKLYVAFRESMDETVQSSVLNEENVVIDSSLNVHDNPIYDKLLRTLKGFTYNKKLYQDVSELQLALTDYLSLEFDEYNYVWDTEYKPSDKFADRIDIYGSSSNVENKFKIVIELDTHRADQVAKKIVSRTALFIEENLIYVSLCYPGTKKMSKPECEKYFQYCNSIYDSLNKSHDKKKLYIGLIIG